MSGGSVEKAKDESQLSVQAFQDMERRDEEQIQRAIMGEYLEDFIYDFPTKDGHRAIGISWVGIKEIAAKMGSIRIDEKPDIRDLGESWFALVKAEDRLRNSSRWGVSTQPKKMKHKEGSLTDDEFAIQKALSKSQRNAIRQLIPERWIQQLIDRFLQGEKKFEPEKVIEAKAEITSFPAPTPLPKPQEREEGQSLCTALKDMFDKDLQDKINFKETGDSITIELVHFLPTELFNRVLYTVKSLGGLYRSETRDFTIPKP